MNTIDSESPPLDTDTAEGRNKAWLCAVVAGVIAGPLIAGATQYLAVWERAIAFGLLCALSVYLFAAWRSAEQHRGNSLH